MSFEANDMKGDLSKKWAGYEFDIGKASFPNSTLPENVDEQIKGFVDKTYCNEYDIFNLRLSRTVFRNTWLVLFVASCFQSLGKLEGIKVAINW